MKYIKCQFKKNGHSLLYLLDYPPCLRGNNQSYNIQKVQIHQTNISTKQTSLKKITYILIEVVPRVPL